MVRKYFRFTISNSNVISLRIWLFFGCYRNKFSVIFYNIFYVLYFLIIIEQQEAQRYVIIFWSYLFNKPHLLELVWKLSFWIYLLEDYQLFCLLYKVNNYKRTLNRRITLEEIKKKKQNVFNYFESSIL